MGGGFDPETTRAGVQPSAALSSLGHRPGTVQRFEAATDVYVDRETVYEFLLSFPDYAKYSEHLDSVTRHGDGSPGTEYDLQLSWWRVSYTARSRVTAVDPPAAIEWELVDDLDARGAWLIEELGDADGESERVDGSRVRLSVEYDPASADASTLGLPRLLGVDALVDRVRPLVREEAERIVERVVADLEGERRPIDLEIVEDA